MVSVISPCDNCAVDRRRDAAVTTSKFCETAAETYGSIAATVRIAPHRISSFRLIFDLRGPLDFPSNLGLKTPKVTMPARDVINHRWIRWRRDVINHRCIRWRTEDPDVPALCFTRLTQFKNTALHLSPRLFNNLVLPYWGRQVETLATFAFPDANGDGASAAGGAVTEKRGRRRK